MTWKTEVPAHTDATLLDDDLLPAGTIAAPGRVWLRLDGVERCEPGRTVVLDEDGGRRRTIRAVIVQVGAHWSSQPEGRSGYHVEVAVPADWQD